MTDEHVDQRVGGPVPGGRRRIDRVLTATFTADLTDLPLATVRARRQEAEQEEVDLSYTRRMLQGRLDILRAAHEQRQHDGGAASLVERLADILADGPPSTRGLGRSMSLQPSRAGESRRAVEQVIADVGLSDVDRLDENALAGAIVRVGELERAVSDLRTRVQQVADTLGAELGRRYVTGVPDATEVLGTGGRGTGVPGTSPPR